MAYHMQTPVSSCRLNAIEKLWNIIKQKFKALNCNRSTLKERTEEEFLSMIRISCDSINRELTDKLIQYPREYISYLLEDSELTSSIGSDNTI